MWRPPWKQALEKIFAAESTPLPWAPPIIQVNELAKCLAPTNMTVHLTYFLLMLYHHRKNELSTCNCIKKTTLTCINFAAVWTFAHACIDLVSTMFTNNYISLVRFINGLRHVDFSPSILLYFMRLIRALLALKNILISVCVGRVFDIKKMVIITLF